MNEKRMNILYQCDDHYAAVTGVSLTSLLENNRDWEEIHIYLIDDRVREENRKKFELLAQRYGRTITFLDMGSISARLEASGAPKWLGSYAAYGRLFAPGMIEEDLDRLLYLDSDTIVTADVSERYNMEREGNVCAMVQDIAAFELYKHIGHRREDAYFNSGVILFDAAAWKTMGCENAVLPFFAAYGSRVNFPDQDALNSILKGKIKRISAKYNLFVQFLTLGIDTNYDAYSLDRKPCYYSREEIEEASRSAVIYHYSSPVKPWIKDTRCALVDQWDKYLRLSPWAGMPKMLKRSLPLRVRIQEEINEHSWPAVQKMVHALYIYAVAPVKARLRKRRASK